MSRVRRRCCRARPRARVVAGVVAFLVALNLVALVISFLRPEPSGAEGSAYATQPRGAAAYAELLRRAGHPVDYLREPLAEARLDARGRRSSCSTRRGWTPTSGPRSGASCATAAGSCAGGPLAGRGIVPRAPLWVPAGPRTARPNVAVPETRGLRSVASAGEGGFSALGGAQPALGDAPALLAVARSGRGRALLLADSSPLQNRLLAQADNAALGLALAGPAGRPVTFAESVHGYGRATGLAAIPVRWRFALAFAVLAGLLWLASRARRLGPPELTGETPTPARREHVEALALGLRRARDAGRGARAVQAAARAQVIRRAALRARRARRRGARRRAAARLRGG